jgi:predicted nucleic acid-binding Zn ribbon protein
VTDTGSRPARQEPRSIGDVLKALLRQKRFLQKGKYSGLTKTWTALVGEAIASRTRIRSFQEGRVVIEVNSSVLLHELNGYMKPQLLAALQASKGGRDAAELRFCLGSGTASSDNES